MMFNVCFEVNMVMLLFHFGAQLEQCGFRTPQCTILGSIDKPEDRTMLKVNYFSWNSNKFTQKFFVVTYQLIIVCYNVIMYVSVLLKLLKEAS